MINFRRVLSFFVISAINFSIFALPFNSKLSVEDAAKLQNGEVLIRNIDHAKNMCIESDNKMVIQLKDSIKNLSPKYLAEVIKIKPYAGNEDLPEKLETMLLNVPDYAGIPYWSERHQKYYDLYSSAEIVQITNNENSTDILADLYMKPFGNVNESINIYKSDNTILYFSENLNTLTYQEKIDCVGKKKMNMCILLFRDGDNWVLYGIGGVNAPKIPFFTERIETSFINRIKTFCNFVFNKLDE